VIHKEEEVSEDKEILLTNDELIAEAPLSGAVLVEDVRQVYHIWKAACMGLMVGSGLRSMTRQRMFRLHIKLYRIFTVDPDLWRQELIWQRRSLMVHITRVSKYFHLNLLQQNVLVHIKLLKNVDVQNQNQRR
jgi:hypothetical protein